MAFFMKKFISNVQQKILLKEHEIERQKLSFLKLFI